MLRTARLLREDFLQQSSFNETDAYCPPAKQHTILSLIMAAHDAMAGAVDGGAPIEEVAQRVPGCEPKFPAAQQPTSMFSESTENPR